MAVPQGVDLFWGLPSASSYQNWGLLLCPCKSDLHCPDYLGGGGGAVHRLHFLPFPWPAFLHPPKDVSKPGWVVFISYLAPSRVPL